MTSPWTSTDHSGKTNAGWETLDRTDLYLQLGLVPIPIAPGTKRPAITRWQLAICRENAYGIIRSTLIRFDWKKDINLGVLCGEKGGVIVLDIDVGDDGLSRWSEISSRHPPIDTFTVQTGGGGLHFYFRWSKEVANLPNVQRVIIDGQTIGWDVRTTGGQVVGPLSTHPTSGKLYLPIAGYQGESYENATVTLSDMPSWIYDLLKAK